MSQGLFQLGAHSEAIDTLHRFMHESCTLDDMGAMPWGEEFHQGLQELKNIFDSLKNMNVPLQNIIFDPLLARGLTYYSGTIYEFFLTGKENLGAIAAGGRYHNLVGEFSKQTLPGVGISFGLSRVFSAFLAHCPSKVSTADILIATQDLKCKPLYMALGQRLRQQNIATEIYLQDHKLAVQLKYADSKEIPFVLVANAQEMNQGHAYVRCMRSGQQELMTHDEICPYIQKHRLQTGQPSNQR
jgi:histidyl-tRNA synthetase